MLLPLAFSHKETNRNKHDVQKDNASFLLQVSLWILPSFLDGEKKTSQEKPKESCLSLQFKMLLIYSPDPVSAGSTIAVVTSSAPMVIRWRSRRAAWRPLYFHPVGKERARERVKWTRKLVSVCQAVCYLLAGFYKLVNSHNSVSVTIHLLGRIEIRTACEI